MTHHYPINISHQQKLQRAFNLFAALGCIALLSGGCEASQGSQEICAERSGSTEPKFLELSRRPPLSDEPNGVPFYITQLLNGSKDPAGEAYQALGVSEYCAEGVCIWRCGAPDNLHSAAVGRAVAHNAKWGIKLFEMAAQYPNFADDRKSIPWFIDSVEAQNLGLVLDKNIDPRMVLRVLSRQLEPLISYLSSTRSLELHSLVVKGSLSNIAVACMVTRHLKTGGEELRGYQDALLRLRRAAEDLAPVIGEEYWQALKRLEDPQQEHFLFSGSELWFFSYRYSYSNTLMMYNDCVSTMLGGFSSSPPACIFKRSSKLWRLNNAVGNILAENMLVGLWANGSNAEEAVELLKSRSESLLSL